MGNIINPSLKAIKATVEPYIGLVTWLLASSEWIINLVGESIMSRLKCKR